MFDPQPSTSRMNHKFFLLFIFSSKHISLLDTVGTCHMIIWELKNTQLGNAKFSTMRIHVYWQFFFNHFYADIMIMIPYGQLGSHSFFLHGYYCHCQYIQESLLSRKFLKAHNITYSMILFWNTFYIRIK